MSTRVSRKLRRVRNALVQATLGVGSVNFWSIYHYLDKGRGGGYASMTAVPEKKAKLRPNIDPVLIQGRASARPQKVRCVGLP